MLPALASHCGELDAITALTHLRSWCTIVTTGSGDISAEFISVDDSVGIGIEGFERNSTRNGSISPGRSEETLLKYGVRRVSNGIDREKSCIWIECCRHQ